MQFNLYQDVKAFYNDAYSILLRHEAQNMIILGNLMIGYEGKDTHAWRDPASWVMATISNEQGILLTALMTPPFNITLHATDNQRDEKALKCLVDGLLANKIAVPGVVAEKSLAESFARHYIDVTKMGDEVTFNQRIYELEAVNPEIRQIGKLRLAEATDMSFFPYWTEGLSKDALNGVGAVQSDPENYLYHIQTGALYILEDEGMPVSMAKISRRIDKVCGIGYVYTPPYFRKKGYASSCVAQLSRLALEQGYQKCVLYTDLANPTSNAIYQKIGYKPICDSVEIKFMDVE